MKPKSTDDVAHLLERAAKAFRAGNLSRAESDAEKVLKSLPDHPEKPLLLTVTYVVVIFSIVVQGLTTGRVVRHYMRKAGAD